MASLSFKNADAVQNFRLNSFKRVTQFNVSKTRYCNCCKKHRSVRQFRNDEAIKCNNCY